MAQPFGVNEDYVLGLVINQPKNEIRVEVVGFKKADAFTPTQVAQQVQLTLAQNGRVGRQKLAQLVYKPCFAFDQARGYKFEIRMTGADLAVLVKVGGREEWQVKVAVKVDVFADRPRLFRTYPGQR